MAGSNSVKLGRILAGKGAPSEIPKVTRRQGKVTAVTTAGLATVTIGDDPTPVPAVNSDSNYVPRVTDAVKLEVTDTEVHIVGRVGNSPAALGGITKATPVATDETVSGGVYGDTPTVGPLTQVNIGDSGRLMVVVSCTMTVTDANDGGFMSFALSGANTLAPSDDMAFQFFPKVTGAYHRGSYVELLSGLTPGLTTVTAKYKTSGADITFKDRKLTAWPM